MATTSVRCQKYGNYFSELVENTAIISEKRYIYKIKQHFSKGVKNIATTSERESKIWQSHQKGI
jgi:hypothetical protein